MLTDQHSTLSRRAALHAALADVSRLRVVDILTLGDASPSELAEALGMPSNLVAHHLGVLEREGIVARTRSEGDRRRSYVRLVPGVLESLETRAARPVPRVLFVCTANAARSHLAAALWRRESAVPVASAGTHPAERIAAATLAAARRHALDLPQVRPAEVEEVRRPGDLVVTVCDRAHEELRHPVDLHWSVPDPLASGRDADFDSAVAELGRRVAALAPRLVPA